MIHKLTHDVWFGNADAPFEAMQMKPRPNAILNVAHHFRDRFNYFERMREVPHDVFYMRLALRDREPTTDTYMAAMTSFVDHAVRLGKLPILTHCQMGGHRGPSSAIFAAWHLAHRPKGLIEQMNARVIEFVPKYAPGNKYRQSLLAWCEANSV